VAQLDNGHDAAAFSGGLLSSHSIPVRRKILENRCGLHSSTEENPGKRFGKLSGVLRRPAGEIPSASKLMKELSEPRAVAGRVTVVR
jgi:hypothetical protein